MLKGRKAPYRVDDKQPVFFSLWAPNEVPLVKLKPGERQDDRNLKFSSGAFHPYGGTQKTGVHRKKSSRSNRAGRTRVYGEAEETLRPGE